MDVDGNNMKCIYCNIEREKLYSGGGLYVYKCPKCSSRMEVSKVDGSWSEE
jgi:tRNA(Ile2) C34 agmatinyltransferase TiaS